MAGLGNLSKVLHLQRTLTAHRLTVPPSGERAVIVIIAMQALVHSAGEEDKRWLLKTSSLIGRISQNGPSDQLKFQGLPGSKKPLPGITLFFQKLRHVRDREVCDLYTL